MKGKLMKNVILTGSTGGIGTAILNQLKQSGFNVIPLQGRLENSGSLESEVKGILSEFDIDAQ